MLAKLRIEGKPSVDVPEEFKSKYVFIKRLRLVFLRLPFDFRTGTANRILEAREKEREKEKDEGKSKAKKRAK